MAVYSLLVCLMACAVVSVNSTSVASAKNKRELPLSYNCNPRLGTCAKGDLISNDIATCHRDAYIFTCSPVGDYFLSSVVDVPDVSVHGVDCVPDSTLPLVCGTEDTRCVCDKAVDITRPMASLVNHCRCQYWPEVDDRADHHSYCTQYDHGGTSTVHFYTCCNNCIGEADRYCDRHVYHGGGSSGDYCSACGQNSLLGGGRITYRFNCVSCSQQAYCESTCSTSMGGYFTSTIPGLCWAWSACFRGCCAKASKGHYKKDTEGNFEFCGDFVCQEGEDHTSCPADCCPDYNPVNCTRPSNQCNPDCCLHPSCCKDESAANTHSASSPLIAFSMLSICIFLSGL